MKGLPLVGLLCLSWIAPSQATVSIQNCGGAASDFHSNCSLQELIDGGSITINGVTFDSFTWSSTVVAGSLGPLTAIRVNPIDSRSRPGLAFTPGRAWDRAARTVTHNELGFRIHNAGPLQFSGRRMHASFGDITGFNLSQGRDSNVFIQDQAFVTGFPPPGGSEMKATLQCFASEVQTLGAPCSGDRRRDSLVGAPPADDFLPSTDMTAKIVLNIVAEAGGHAGLDGFDYRVEMPYLLAETIVPDMNGNGVDEIAVVDEDKNQVHSVSVEVRGGLGGTLLGSQSFFNNLHTPVALVALPDLDGNGVPELAVLAVRDSDGQGIVEIRNASGPATPRRIFLSSGHEALAMKTISGDFDGNGIPELGVLSSRVSDGRERIDVFNAFGPLNRQSLIYNPDVLEVLDFTSVEDGNGDDSPEIAALAQNVNSGLYVVDVRNLGGPALSETRSLRAGLRPSAIAAIADANGNGIPELAVLQTDLDTGMTRVEVRDELGAANPRLYSFAGGTAARPLAFLGLLDTDGDSVAEFAVLFDQELTAATTVVINDADGPGDARTIPFTRGHHVETFGMALLGDADGNGSQELALLQSGGVFHGASSPLSVEIRNVAGPAVPRYFGFFVF